jgi:ParB family chromosome partitioning protein
MTAIAPPPAIPVADQEEELLNLPLDLLFESPKNPRKTFDPAKLRELADSMKEHGQLTPGLARPVRGGPNDGMYELAAGHRRFRAMPIAGRTTMRVVVRPMTDVQLLEKQLDDISPAPEKKPAARAPKKKGR